MFVCVLHYFSSLSDLSTWAIHIWEYDELLKTTLLCAYFARFFYYSWNKYIVTFLPFWHGGKKSEMEMESERQAKPLNMVLWMKYCLNLLLVVERRNLTTICCSWCCCCYRCRRHWFTCRVKCNFFLTLSAPTTRLPRCNASANVDYTQTLRYFEVKFLFYSQALSFIQTHW